MKNMLAYWMKYMNKNKPKNMADMYDHLSSRPGRDQSTLAKSGYQTESPEVNYVYQSKKKAVVMVRK